MSTWRLKATPSAEGTSTLHIEAKAHALYTAPSGIDVSMAVEDMNKPLSDYTPQEIQAAVQSGEAPSLWSVGDECPIRLDGSSLYGTNIAWVQANSRVRIIGINHNAAREGTKSLHFELMPYVSNYNGHTGSLASGSEFAGLCMNVGTYYTEGESGHWGTTEGGWKLSDMRSRWIPMILATFPADWQAIMKAIPKYTSNGSAGKNNTTAVITATNDKLWICSQWEIFGSVGYSNPYEKNYQEQYGYYKNDADRKRDTLYPTRSPGAISTFAFCAVSTEGSEASTPASNLTNIVLCFAVA